MKKNTKVMKRIGRRNEGFTLAELLIVVAVIGVLVAISIPIFSSQLEKSRRAVDISNARSIKSALILAMQDDKIRILNDGGTIVLQVTRKGTDGGRTGNSKDYIIDGKMYVGQKDVWNVVSQYGISDKLTMKQKNKDIEWYCVSINGKGESYYYEGKGSIVDFAKYKKDWSN